MPRANHHGVRPPASGRFKPGESGNASGPKPGQLQRWTLPVLQKLAKHHPEAIRRIGAIVRDKDHKDHFGACKFVCETLIRDSYSKYAMPDRGELRIVIEMASEPQERKEVVLDAELVQIAAETVTSEARGN